MFTACKLFLGGTIIGLALLLSITTSKTVSASFYEGKTVTVVAGYSPGGAGVLRTQSVGKYIQKHLPGDPRFVYKYMPGGGGTAAANYMAKIAKRDGFTIANIGSGIFPSGLFQARGVRFKLGDFIFLGASTSGGPYTLLTRRGLDLDTVEKLKAYRGLRFGQRYIGHSLYVLDRLLAYVLGLKEPKWVLGYNNQEIRRAITQDETDAETNSISSFLRRNRLEMLKDGYHVPIVIKNSRGRGTEMFPKFPRRPYLEDYADTKLKRAVLRFHKASKPSSTNFLVPKGIPDAALKALREAIHRTWKDPEFVAEYRRLNGQAADPVTGDEIHQSLKSIPADPKIKKIYKTLAEGGPLPPSG